MCGRYTLLVSNKPDVAKLGLQNADRFNIAPQSQVVIKTGASNHASAHWGIPLGAAVLSLTHGLRHWTPFPRSRPLRALADGCMSGSVSRKQPGTTTMAEIYSTWRASISALAAVVTQGRGRRAFIE